MMPLLPDWAWQQAAFAVGRQHAPDSCLYRHAVLGCAGMHSVSLSFETDVELEQSTNFLKLAHPLNYTAAVKKSQVRRGPAHAAAHTTQGRTSRCTSSGCFSAWLPSSVHGMQAVLSAAPCKGPLHVVAGLDVPSVVTVCDPIVTVRPDCMCVASAPCCRCITPSVRC